MRQDVSCLIFKMHSSSQSCLLQKVSIRINKGFLLKNNFGTLTTHQIDNNIWPDICKRASATLRSWRRDDKKYRISNKRLPIFMIVPKCDCFICFKGGSNSNATLINKHSTVLFSLCSLTFYYKTWLIFIACYTTPLKYDIVWISRAPTVSVNFLTKQSRGRK